MSKRKKAPPAKVASALPVCSGCGVSLGDRHSDACAVGICWKCGETRAGCNCDRNPGRQSFPFNGSYLEELFARKNLYYPDADEFDFMPTYAAGQMEKLRANRFDPGAWRAIEWQPQTRGLIDFTFASPDLIFQNLDDGAGGLARSGWRQQLRKLQFGKMDRAWDAVTGKDEARCDGDDTQILVDLIEEMHWLRELYLSVDLPDLSPLISATFPRWLEMLHINSFDAVDLGILAAKRSLGLLNSLVIRRPLLAPPAKPDFPTGFQALVNAAICNRVHTLRIEMPEVDDACCQSLVNSPIVKHLERLYLVGNGVTDAGASILAASADVRALKDLWLDGKGLTQKGCQTLLSAGVPLRSPPVPLRRKR